MKTMFLLITLISSSALAGEFSWEMAKAREQAAQVRAEAKANLEKCVSGVDESVCNCVSLRAEVKVIADQVAALEYDANAPKRVCYRNSVLMTVDDLGPDFNERERLYQSCLANEDTKSAVASNKEQSAPLVAKLKERSDRASSLVTSVCQ
jgi:glycerol-3-phosphate O-acyltransferase